MPTPQEEQLNANIDLLLAIHYDGMDAIARQDLMDSMEDIRDEYRLAAEKGKSDKYYKDLGDSIAKSLPGIVKGASSAADAFKKGDYIAGTAALMDICASVIPVFASLASATGPQGALIGALFSVVGQILSLFAPKQPSLEDKIKKMLDHLQGEAQIQNITAVGHSISSYTDSIRARCSGTHKMESPVALAGTVSLTSGSKTVTGKGTAFTRTAYVGQWLLFDSDAAQKPYKIDAIESDTRLLVAMPYVGASAASTQVKQLRRVTTRRSIAEILAMPLTSEAQADDFYVEMKGLNFGLEHGQAKLDIPVFATWQVAGYLERPENQEKEGWPEVLGVWCRTYADLLSANMMLACLADPKTLDQRIEETRETNPDSRLPTEARERCHKVLLKLKMLGTTLRNSWQSDKKEMLKIVEKLRPVARERGLFAHVGHYAGGNILYIASGSGRSDALKWNYKKDTEWLNGISIHTPKNQRDSFTPRYELLSCGNNGKIDRHALDSISGELFGRAQVIASRRDGGGETFLDVSAIAMNDPTIGIDSKTRPVTLTAVAIKRSQSDRFVNHYTIDRDNESTRVNWEPHLAGLETVRCLYLPPTPLAGDPDADAMADANASPPGPPLLAQDSVIIYGGAVNVDYIHVVAWNAWGSVKGPEHWTSYNGIEVDPYYVWVFGKGGIACATHASVIKCRQGKLERPSWVYHDFDKTFQAPEVVSLYPCADGTLVVAMQDDIYTADYSINRASMRVVTSSWVKRGGNAKQVIKMVIPCWPVLESLRADLQSE